MSIKIEDNIEKRCINMDKYECIKLKNQVCFPLYACSNAIIRKYKPYLDELGLTYTQYITMMVLWENKQINVKELGEKLYLDSGTLTPLLKKLEAKGLITRKRLKEDERNVIISITNKGEDLKEMAVKVPKKISNDINLTQKEAMELYKILYKVLDNENTK